MGSGAAHGTPVHARQYALDLLRIVAMFGVMAGHASPWPWTPAGYGVTIFFVLSGMLVTRGFLDEWGQGGEVAVGAFYARRLRRILPIYYLYVIGSLTIDVLLGHAWSGELELASFGFGVNYFNASHGHPSTAMAHTWSLSVEQQFYLVWPLLFVALARAGRRALSGGLVAVILGSLVWRLHLWNDMHVGSAYVWNAFETRADALAVGCLLACHVEGRWATAVKAHAARHWWVCLVTLAAVVASRAPGLPADYAYGLGFTVTALLAGVLIVQLLGAQAHHVLRSLDRFEVRWIGRLTFPLYLMHPYGLAVARRLHGPMAARAAVAVGAVFLFAMGLQWTVDHGEETVRRFVRAIVHEPDATSA